MQPFPSAIPPPPSLLPPKLPVRNDGIPLFPAPKSRENFDEEDPCSLLNFHAVPLYGTASDALAHSPRLSSTARMAGQPTPASHQAPDFTPLESREIIAKNYSDFTLVEKIVIPIFFLLMVISGLSPVGYAIYHLFTDGKAF
jgi:hypothetical protein